VLITSASRSGNGLVSLIRGNGVSAPAFSLAGRIRNPSYYTVKKFFGKTVKIRLWTFFESPSFATMSSHPTFGNFFQKRRKFICKLFSLPFLSVSSHCVLVKFQSGCRKIYYVFFDSFLSHCAMPTFGASWPQNVCKHFSIPFHPRFPSHCALVKF